MKQNDSNKSGETETRENCRKQKLRQKQFNGHCLGIDFYLEAFKTARKKCSFVLAQWSSKLIFFISTINTFLIFIFLFFIFCFFDHGTQIIDSDFVPIAIAKHLKNHHRIKVIFCVSHSTLNIQRKSMWLGIKPMEIMCKNTIMKKNTHQHQQQTTLTIATASTLKYIWISDAYLARYRSIEIDEKT